jgi:hypothetical protein
VIDRQRLAERRDIWLIAAAMVEPLVEQHGIEKYPVRHGPTLAGSIFSAPNSVMTPIEQHLSHIEQTAEWLMGETEVAM